MTNPKPATVGAVVPAAGVSTRFPGNTRKQFRQLGRKPLLVYTLERIWAADIVQVVAVAVPEEELSAMQRLLQPLSPSGVGLEVVPGGKTRQASVATGLAAIPNNIDITVVHDAVRPLFETRWVRETVILCQEFDGAIVAIPTTDTLKEVDKPADPIRHHRCIQRTVPRESIWQAQTPQTFQTDILRRALRHAEEKGTVGTDEAALVEAIGGRVAVVEGSSTNIKVTTPEDWHYLEWRLIHG